MAISTRLSFLCGGILVRKLARFANRDETRGSLFCQSRIEENRRESKRKERWHFGKEIGYICKSKRNERVSFLNVENRRESKRIQEKREAECREKRGDTLHGKRHPELVNFTRFSDTAVQK